MSAAIASLRPPGSRPPDILAIVGIALIMCAGMYIARAQSTPPRVAIE